MKIKIKFLAAVALLASGLSILAQTPVKPAVYYLTNSTTFTIASGGTNVAGSGSTTINSQPFPIWRGRGFALNTSSIGTNASTALLTYNFQFATPIYVNGAWVTNWSTYGGAAVSVPMNGTTRVYSVTNLPTVIDNVTLGRLSTVANAHTASAFLDPTNTFISVIP